MEDVKNIQKIDIHAHAVAFREYYPPRLEGNPDSVFVSAEQVIAFYDKLGLNGAYCFLLPHTRVRFLQ